MLKRSVPLVAVSILSALLLSGCTSGSETPDAAVPPPTRYTAPASASPSIRASAAPTASATPSVTPTGKSLPIKDLIPKNNPTTIQSGKPSVIAKGSTVNLAAIAVAHWRKNTVVAPDTNTWQQNGTTGTMRGTITSGSGVGERYLFKLSKQGSTWQVDSATRA